MLVRHADPSRDGAACAAIYAPFVSGTAVSFEESAPDALEMAQRIEAISRSYPWLVAQEAEAVVGYAYASTHRDRAAYRWAVDVAVYVGAAQQRRGIGRTLYNALLGLLREQGVYIACAGITLPNPASVALHQACGFQLVGVYRGIGWKAGAWHDVGWWQCQLLARAEAPPPELRPPCRLDRAPGPGGG